MGLVQYQFAAGHIAAFNAFQIGGTVLFHGSRFKRSVAPIESIVRCARAGTIDNDQIVSVSIEIRLRTHQRIILFEMRNCVARMTCLNLIIVYYVIGYNKN